MAGPVFTFFAPSTICDTHGVSELTTAIRFFPKSTQPFTLIGYLSSLILYFPLIWLYDLLTWQFIFVSPNFFERKSNNCYND